MARLIEILIPDEIEDLSPNLQRFFEAMVYKLRKNAHKGRWENLNSEQAFELAQNEVEELKQAMREGNSIEITLEGADVANFALMLASIAERDCGLPQSRSKTKIKAIKDGVKHRNELST